MENLEETFKSVYNLLEFGDFARVREVLNFRISDRFRDIDQRNTQIEKLTEDLDLLFTDNTRAKSIRTYVENWQNIRDEVVQRIRQYQEDTLESNSCERNIRSPSNGQPSQVEQDRLLCPNT